MKVFMFRYEGATETGKNTVDYFVMSFLVPEISALKMCKMAPKVVHL